MGEDKKRVEQSASTSTLFYRRRLPHWHPDGAILFFTYRLVGSLPSSALQRLAKERDLLLKEPMRPDETPRDRALRAGRRLFELADEELARSLRVRGSPRWLEDERVARIVRENLRHWDGVRYRMHRYVIMPNHVHVLLAPLVVAPAGPRRTDEPPPRWPVAKITQGLKGYTSREANRLLSRTGTFWQDESFDHWIRDEADYARTVDYIDHNPVVAGLCARPEEWPWSSAGEEAAEKRTADARNRSITG